MTGPSIVLDVPLMDDDHARLEALFGRLPATADADLPALLAEVEAETRAHFEREEGLMQAADVPVFFCHVAQHKIIMAEFAKAHDAMARNDLGALRQFIGVTLAGLVEAHIDSVDRVTAGFLKGEFAAEAFDNLRLPDPSSQR